MRASLHALTEELRRLKAAGVETVSVSEESLTAMRKWVAARSAAAGEPVAAARGASADPSAARDEVHGPAPAAPSREPPPTRAITGSSMAPASRAELPPPPQVRLPDADKQTRWNALLAAVRADPVCRENVRPGKHVVLGVGDLDARIFFCGEAPGAEEEIQGEPFVGPAGALLTKMIAAMGLKREAVYIGNIMNWRPQLPTVDGAEQVGNRPPTPEEMAYCLPYLRAQLEVVQPAVIVALGSTAAKGLLGSESFRSLGEIRGRWLSFADKPVMVTYHPSYILRNQSNRSKRLIWEDLLQVMERVGLPISERQRGFFLGR